MQQQCISFFRKMALASRGLPDAEDYRRWRDTSPPPSSLNVTTLYDWPPPAQSKPSAFTELVWSRKYVLRFSQPTVIPLFGFFAASIYCSPGCIFCKYLSPNFYFHFLHTSLPLRYSFCHIHLASISIIGDYRQIKRSTHGVGDQSDVWLANGSPQDGQQSHKNDNNEKSPSN